MRRFRVIPVIDVKGGVAVQAVGGLREQYQPLKTWLHGEPDPAGIARALEAAYGFRELYLADLDAIAGSPLNLNLLSEVASLTGMQVMADCGFRSLQTVGEALENGVAMAVLGTETLPSLTLVEEAVQAYGSSHITVSVDLAGGRLLAASPEISRLTLAQLAEGLNSLNLRRLLVIDLSRVGRGCGVGLNEAFQVLEKFEGEVIVGGGVRGIADLERLAGLGFSGALVAAALHTRRIKPEELADRGFTGWV